ncbi:MAG: hypothetical protein LBG52_01135 [Candidatus Peribacteria bacterium]|jgi:hypothetical protein|nr:hypothetical protein [Candidatus Peribacteria bacterium]
MKFFFAKTDSLYKIFKTLEKVPNGRKVEIFIDPEHALFDNSRRGKQIKEILDQKHLEATFTTKSSKNRAYFREVGLSVDQIKERNIEKAINLLYLFLFNIKKFHLHTYESKKYIFALIFLFEAVFIGIVLRVIISLILPSATLTIQPAEDLEQIIYNFRYYPASQSGQIADSRYLTIPYYTGSIDYKYDLVISTANIKHITNPSQGQIKIYNTKPLSYSLVASTRFVTAEGLVFRAMEDIIIATGDAEYPSETVISVQADERDENDQIIGVRGNIPMKTQMWIKNLNESYYLREIWAESMERFQGGSTQSFGSVTDKDIATLTGKLVDQIYKQKMNVVSQNFAITDGVLLPFESITRTHFTTIDVDQPGGAETPTIKGTAYVSYLYHYIYRKDLLKAFTTYIKERPSEKIQVLHIDQNSIKFIKDTSSFEQGELRKDGETFIIPTQITVVQGYDFLQDSNKMLSQLKELISGKAIEEARIAILSTYMEVGSVKISVAPLRYTTVPTIKSRIKIHIPTEHQ